MSSTALALVPRSRQSGWGCRVVRPGLARSRDTDRLFQGQLRGRLLLDDYKGGTGTLHDGKKLCYSQTTMSGSSLRSLARRSTGFDLAPLRASVALCGLLCLLLRPARTH